MSRRPEITGRKSSVSADRARRSSGPRKPDPTEIEPTQHGQPVAYRLPQTPPIRGPPPPLAYDVKQFCEATRISLRMYFKLRDSGCGPKETRIGRRVLITLESAMAWMQAREAATVQSETSA